MTTLKTWGIRLDQMYLMGGLPKEPILREFKPHIFFDDTMKHIDSAKGSVAVGWVPAGVLATSEAPAEIPPTTETTLASPSVPNRLLETLTAADFETGCRKVFSGYMPDAEGKRQPLDPRFRAFIAKNKVRPVEERAVILRRLQRFDLASLGATHQPKLNRSRNDHLARKLAEIAEIPPHATPEGPKRTEGADPS